jgi:hypothetical protein
MNLKRFSCFAIAIISVFIFMANSHASERVTNSYRIFQASPDFITKSSYLTSATKSIAESDSDFKLCNSVDSLECKVNKVSEAQWFGAYLSLPKCDTNRSQWCISELLEYRDGKNTSLKFIKYSSNSHVLSQPSVGLPEGKSASLWKNVQTNELFTINSRLNARYSPYYENQFKISDFGTTIHKVEVISDAGISSESLVPTIESNVLGEKQLYFSKLPLKCVWAALRECGITSEMNLNSKLVLILNVGNEVGGWLDGRLGSPRISTKKISNTQYQLKIEANPISVPQYEAEIDVSKVPNTLRNFDPTTQYPGGKGNYASAPNFELFNYWTSLVKNQSDKEENVWNFNSITNGNNLNCLNRKDQVLGLVTSNSTIYQGTSPELINGSLNYRVGAPHFSSIGKVLQGYYYLSLRKDVAKCLYKYTKTPTSAKVQIQNIDGTSYIATSTLKESNGWLNLRVAGFTYSTPKISVSFPTKK